jgi:hypothetical protein
MLCSYRATEFAAYLQVAVLSIVLRSSDCDPVTLKELNASTPRVEWVADPPTTRFAGDRCHPASRVAIQREPLRGPFNRSSKYVGEFMKQYTKTWFSFF